MSEFSSPRPPELYEEVVNCNFVNWACVATSICVEFRLFFKIAEPQKGENLMKTYSAKPESVQREWFIVDAAEQTLGRLATEIALRLKGKHKPEYTPHVDTGDYIVVINADKVRVTGNKTSDKMYYRHTGYPGGLRSISFDKLLDHKPEMIIEQAVKGMLPKNPLGRDMYRKLKVYAGSEHPHAAQQPQTLEING